MEKFSFKKLRELDKMFNENHNVKEEIVYFDSNDNICDKEHAVKLIVTKFNEDTGERIGENIFFVSKENEMENGVKKISF